MLAQSPVTATRHTDMPPQEASQRCAFGQPERVVARPALD